MKPVLENKRQVVTYLPYKRLEGALFFFLQKRDASAPVHPNVYSLFGGGMEENETLEAALRREVREELDIEPSAPVHLMDCSTGYGDFFVFIEEVGDDFESRITVNEGEGGSFIESKDVQVRPDVSAIARIAVEGTTWYLNGAKRIN